jgi:hypothetical protein
MDMENKSIYCRGYLQAYTSEEGNKKGNRPQWNFSPAQIEYPRVLVFDTETTIDIYQNLTFGSFILADQKKNTETAILFYADNLKETDPKGFNELLKYSEKNKISLISRSVFLKRYFFPECYAKETPCVGFNPAFDLSRIANECLNTRQTKAKKGAIKLRFSDIDSVYDIQIKRFGLAEQISFLARKHLADVLVTSKKTGKGKMEKRWKKYTNEETNKGVFLDVQHLYSVFYASGTEKFSLEDVTKKLNLPETKQKAHEHGIINEEYIEYNLRDVRTTYHAFMAILKYKNFIGLKLLRLEAVYSGASIGKHLFKEMNINPFQEMNPNYPAEKFGRIMGTFYAGRVEANLRHEERACEVLDFASMYPTIFTLTDLQKFITATGYIEKIETERIRNLVNNIKVSDFEGKAGAKLWPKLIGIVKIRPNGDYLPSRAGYDEESQEKTVAIQYITSPKPMWFTLMDVIGSKIRTGKSPEILEGILFYPKDQIKTLTTTKVLGYEIDPRKDNFFKFFVEKRAELKKEMKALKNEGKAGTSYYQELDGKQLALKIISNATSYGICIEENTVDTEDEIEINIGDEKFYSFGRSEKDGKFFNPLVATTITAGARLLLIIGEKISLDLGEPHYYMDTDSIFVNPRFANQIMKFFNSFNPYTNVDQLLKIEDDKLKDRYGNTIKRVLKEDGLYYPTQYVITISSKRYVCYAKDENGFPDVDAMEGKLHGLGHITKLFQNLETAEDKKMDRKVKQWHHFVWRDIILYIKGELDNETINTKYGEIREISKMSIRTPVVLNHFRYVNKGKPWEKQIKPYNFFLKGNSVDEAVVPIAPFKDNPQEIVSDSFVNGKTALLMKGQEYFKRMDITFRQYCEHPEKKFEGNSGFLKRREIFVTEIKVIGKEIDAEKMFEGDDRESQTSTSFEELSLGFLETELRKAKEHKTLRDCDIEKTEREISLRKEMNMINHEALKKLIKKVRRVSKTATRKVVPLTEKQKETILNLSVKDGEKIGLPKRSLMNVKSSLRSGKPLNENIRSTKIIIDYLNKLVVEV